METKLFEVRDRMTFIPVIAIKLSSSSEAERYLLAMAGYGLQSIEQEKHILVGKAQTGELHYAYQHHPGYPGVRTMGIAHQHILKHYEEMNSGDVLDVEFILGEVEQPKISQRIDQC